ncbi:hypothetical protein JOM56_013252 [Amanita muscaria]
MDDLDIQTAQLIIQLARDDIYQFDDNAFGGNNQDGDLLSDLEFALAEQEREFMQHWTGYGGTQINQNAGGPSRRTGGGGNAGNGAVAGPSRVPNPRPATPINLIDIDDDYDDIYVNPYSAASSSSDRARSPEPASRAATPILVPIDDVHEPVPDASSSSSNDRNHNSNDDNRRPDNPFNANDRDDTDHPVLVNSLLSAWLQSPSDSQPTTNNSIGATTSSAGSALPDHDGPHPNSPTLEQLLEQVFALANGPGSQTASSSTASTTVNRASGSQVPQAGPSNSLPQRTNAISRIGQ